MITRITSLVALGFLAFTLPALAQRGGGMGNPTGSISGVVTDSTGAPLPHATITLRSTRDTSAVTGAYAKQDGSFTIPSLRPGQYKARITFLGYKAKTVPVTIKPGDNDIPLGTIELGTDPLVTQEVRVTAKRDFMTVEVDRTTFKVSEMPVVAGGTGTDVLRNIPSIDVDADGNVSLRGNQNVAIQLNGRPLMLNGTALANFLKSFPANSIERIEVIPNPSAKYDPDGMTGIINIVLKQDSHIGFNGGVNAGIGTSDTYNAGANLNYGDGPWNVFANYGFYSSKRPVTGTQYLDSHIGTYRSILDEIATDTSSNLGHSFNGTVDYSFDKANSVEFAAVLSHNSGSSPGLNAYKELDSNLNLVNRYDRTTGGDELGNSMDYRLSYKWAPEPSKRELSIEARGNANWNSDSGNFNQRNLTPTGSPADETPTLQHTSNDQTRTRFALQGDYMQPVWVTGKLEAGYKGELEKLDNTIFSETYNYSTSTFQPDLNINNSFNYQRQIHAVYGTLTQEFGEITAQAGVRLEEALTKFNLSTTGASYDNNYFSAFPSGFLMYKPSEYMQIKLNYSRRINRPWIYSLNPFTDLTDPKVHRTGNPYLQPEYVNSFELGFSHFTDNTTLTVTPYFRRTTDVMKRFETVDSNGISTLTFQNFDKSDSYGADVIASLRLGDVFNGFVSFSGYRIVTDASNVDASLSNDSWGWNGRVNATVNIYNGLSAQGTYFYRAPINIEGGRIDAFTSTDLALSQKLFDNRLQLGLRVSDLFNTMQFHVVRTDSNFTQTGTHKWMSRSLMFTASYTFGSAQQRPRMSRPNTDQRDQSPQDME